MTEQAQNDRPPCANHEKRLDMVELSVSHMQRTMESVSTKLDLILAQITKVAILEEKHSNIVLDNDRAHKKIETLTNKVEDLAKETRAFISYSQGRDKVLWVLAVAIAGLFVKVLFFASAHGMTP